LSGYTNNWQRHKAVGKKVVIQAGKICSASGQELNGGRNLNCKGALTFDNVKEFLLLLGEIMALAIEVLDYLQATVHGDEGGNIVKRRVVCEEALIRRSEKPLVRSLKIHDCNVSAAVILSL
jgi:hypothetical protein